MLKDFLKDSVRKVPIARRIARNLSKNSRVKKKQAEIELYHQWLKSHEPTQDQLSQQRLDAKNFAYQPLLSVVTPTYDTPADYFKEMVESVQAQSYENWELILVDDASPNGEVRALIEEYAAKDNRIKYTFLKKGQHIAGATNVAIEQASGEFISLFDHDDTLRPNALFEIALALNRNRALDFIYTDEDKLVDGLSLRADPFFKPAWNQDYLYSINYITHFTTIRKTIFEKAGYEDGRFNGAQDWELFLRITRSIKSENIHHIPKVLYSWRVHANSTAQSLGAKPYVLDAQRQAIAEDLDSKGFDGFTLSQDPLYSAQWRLDFPVATGINLTVIDTSKGISYEAVNRSEGEVILLASDGGRLTEYTSLISDALRKDIGLVVPRAVSKAEVMVNVRSILNEDISDYIESLEDSLSYHYYRTSRYNLSKVKAGAAVVEKAKLLAVLAGSKSVNSIEEVGDLLSIAGYRHLYNPYSKV